MTNAKRPADKDVSDYFGTVDFPLKAHVSPHGRVTAVSMMKDEGPFVLEWVAHHLAVGFTDLVVYTNDCSDGTDDMLIRLEELGLVHHRRNDIPEGIRPQPSALKYAQTEPVVMNSDWVLVFDADEFLCIKFGDHTLDDMIAEAVNRNANGIVVTWRIFGSSEIQDWSRDPVTEQYLYAAPPMWNKGWGVKTLFKFDPEYWKLGIHRPKMKNKHLETDFPHSVQWLNGSGLPMEDYFKFRGWRSISRTVGYDWVQMNHYAVKSMDSYAIRKLRGNVNNKKDKYNSDYWSLQDRNEVFDDSALLHAERRKEIFDILLTDPVLAELHQDAVERVENRLDEYRTGPAYKELIDGLREASQVPIDKVVAKPPKARDPAKIAALMSGLEKKLAKPDKPGHYETEAVPPSKADIYLPGSFELAGYLKMQLFSNHDILIPADSRVFTGMALNAIAKGAFCRNHARRLPGLLRETDTYLEIGAGIGFLATRLHKMYPGLTIVAQEERTQLVQTLKSVWAINKTAEDGKATLVEDALATEDNAEQIKQGLAALLQKVPCTFLYLNDPRIEPEILGAALATLSDALPGKVVIGEQIIEGDVENVAYAEALKPLHYGEVDPSPLNNSLLFLRASAPQNNTSETANQPKPSEPS